MSFKKPSIFILLYFQASGKKGKKSKKGFADIDWYLFTLYEAVMFQGVL